jgi:flagellar basal body P-ring protein FlgI
MWIFTITMAGLLGCLHPQARLQKEDDGREKEVEVKTIGDVTEVDNAAPTVVSGVGLVTGLDGTGGGAPPGMYKTLLETELRKSKVEHVRELLASDNTALVIVTAFLMPGAHKEDALDVQVTLPPNSNAKSLRGGYLQECSLFNYETAKHLNPNYQGGDKYLRGHILAQARGALLVGFGQGAEADEQKVGHIWGGGTSLIDRPFFLTLKTGQQFTRIAAGVADRINQTFREDNRKHWETLSEVTTRLGQRFDGPDALDGGLTAKAQGPEFIYVRVPYQYRLNPERYLRVARLIPLQDSPEIHTRYRRRLQEKLLDPAQAITAALRLEALGKESVPALKAGLASKQVLVRFCSAEALAYLGNPSAGQELARLVEQQPKLRGYCLTAMASLNEAVCRVKLSELLACPSAETRYGAFRALRNMGEPDPEIQGELLNDSYWLHRLAAQSPPLVHLSCSRRAEVCLFGEEPSFVPPAAIVAGEFTVTAGPSDDKCIVGRFPRHGQAAQRRVCSLKLQDILRTLAELGALYSDVSEVLNEMERTRCLTCRVLKDALPQTPRVEDLAEHATKPDYFNNGPDDENEKASGPSDADAAGVRESREVSEDSPGRESEPENELPHRHPAAHVVDD